VLVRRMIAFLKSPPSLGLTDVQRARMEATVRRAGHEPVILNLGSKDTPVPGKVVNVDIAPFSNVAVISDAQNLAIRSQRVDVVFAIAILEIVERPELVVDEIFRVLRPSGWVVATTPFLQSYHPDPVDTHRFTVHGARRLFQKFEIEELVPTRGVFGSLLCLLRDYLAVLLCFNSVTLWKLNNIALAWFMLPWKYLDRVLPDFPKAEYVSSSFTIVARKPTSHREGPQAL
jgi:SAM-dependent methyltransferase